MPHLRRKRVAPQRRGKSVARLGRGKLIVLEGIDGSGKRTQLHMLARALASRGIPFTQLSFPRYGGFFGKMVAQFLNGQFGSLDSVDPHFSSLLYAGDRLDAKHAIESALRSGRVVLADRYIGSNLAHQGARVPRARRAAFLAWLTKLEYEIYALPPEDLVIYLRVPPSEAHRLVGQKAARKYTKRRRDILEASVAHLATASHVYDQLARQRNWVKIDCAEPAQRGKAKPAARESRKSPPPSALRPPESIHEELMRAVASRALPELRAE
jgi:dTMP kinase